jgi:CubicO group peptidase (beta-lactamase class C family)
MVVDAAKVGMNTESLTRVESLFREQIENGTHPGAAMAVYRHGKLVLDLYGGISHTETGEPVTKDSLFVLMSSTKPLAAACMALLKERGKLAYDDRVTQYWPEFGKNGKESVTIRHVLTHTAGMPQTPEDLTWDKWRDWDTVARAMENATPKAAPGAEIAYHSVNFGWLIAELVRRIDGRPFPQFLREEITGPLGMNDTYVGLPANLEPRVCRMHAMEDAQDSTTPTTFSRPEVHAAVVPGACGIATARDIARFYAILEQRGTLDGVRVMAPETVADLTTLQVEGDDRTINQPARRTLGLMLGVYRMGTPADDYDSFGHGGAGTSICWANHRLGLAVVIITNGFRAAATNEPRLYALSKAVREACD